MCIRLSSGLQAVKVTVVSRFSRAQLGADPFVAISSARVGIFDQATLGLPLIKVETQHRMLGLADYNQHCFSLLYH